MKYGSTEVTLNIPDDSDAYLVTGHDSPHIADIKGSLIKSISSPIGSLPLKERIHKGDRVALVISDMSRFWMRQDLVIPHLTEYLTEECGIKDKDLTIVVANGTHTGGDEKELRTLVTDSVYDRFSVVNHDAGADDLIYIGTTSFGNRISVNRHVAEADRVIALGAVTHHVMAGFGGGRKSILPGVSSLETIRFNHALSLDDNEFVPDPRTGNGVLDGNPVHLDMCEAAGFIKDLFVINLVMAPDMVLSGIYSGEYMASWLEAVRVTDGMYSTDVDREADIIVAGCGGYPKDMSMYQGTKTIDNVEGALKEGGTLVFIAECRDGGGPEEYFGWMKDLKEGTFEKRLRGDFTIPGFIFFINVRQAEKFNILMYTSIPPEVLSPMGIRAFSDMDELLKNVDFSGKRTYVMPSGGTVVPKVTG